VKVGPVIRPKIRLVPLKALRGPELDAAFTAVSPTPDLDHAAFLGWVALSDHLVGSRDYLAVVSPDDPRSGTGQQAYVGDPAALEVASNALRRGKEPWTQTMDDEVTAGALMVRALRAFSSQRNLSAANYIDQLHETFIRSLVVSGLNP
jgi:hypothetical protein